MIEDKTTVVFPVLNAVSLPLLLVEMIDQGMPAPQFVQSGITGQPHKLFIDQILSYGGEKAAIYYDGAFIVDSADTGVWRLPDTENTAFPDPFSEMCNREYARVTNLPKHDPLDKTSFAYSYVSQACALVRITARVLRDAGVNPRQADINWVLYRLDEVDLPRMLPTSSARRKNDLPDVVRNLQYQYSCQFPSESGASTDLEEMCVIPIGDWQIFR